MLCTCTANNGQIKTSKNIFKLRQMFLYQGKKTANGVSICFYARILKTRNKV